MSVAGLVLTLVMHMERGFKLVDLCSFVLLGPGHDWTACEYWLAACMIAISVLASLKGIRSAAGISTKIYFYPSRFCRAVVAIHLHRNVHC